MRIKAKPLRPCQGRLVDKGSSRIVGAPAAAVRAVRIAGKSSDARGPSKGNGECQGIFLVWAAAAFSAQRDRQLPPGQDDGVASLRLEIERKRRVSGSDAAGLALDLTPKKMLS